MSNRPGTHAASAPELSAIWDGLCREIVGSSADCIKVLDARARLLWINDSGRRLMEVCDVAGMLGSCWLDFWAGDTRERAEEAVTNAVERGTGRFSGPCPTAGGTLKWWSVVLTRLERTSGDVRLLAVSRDITEVVTLLETQRTIADAERLAREEAERASRSRESILYSVSHDLRVPLAAILGWSSLLAESVEDRSVVAAAAAIQSAAAHQMRLLDHLLDAARLDTSPSVPSELVSLPEIVEQALALCKPSIDAKRLHVEVRCGNAGASVLGDHGELVRMTCNLVANAVKFTPVGGRLDIGTEVDGGSASLVVSDSGCGLTPEATARAFDRFWKADTSPAAQDGLGLGLAIVRSIAERHGGTVHAHSDGPGLGARFIVTLPLFQEYVADDSAGAAAEDGDAVVADLDLTGVGVVLLDTNPDTRAVIAGVLRHFGADVVAAGDARDVVPSGTRVIVADESCHDQVATAASVVLLAGPDVPSPADCSCVRLTKPVAGRTLAAHVRDLHAAQTRSARPTA